MKTLRLVLVASGLVLLLPAAGFAQTTDDMKNMTPEQRREYVRGLSDAERQALREQHRAEWQNKSPEERAAIARMRRDNRETNRSAMREHWNSLSDEERQAARQAQREQAEQRRETWNNLSDEEKAAARQHLRDRRNAMRDGRGDRRHDRHNQRSRTP